MVIPVKHKGRATRITVSCATSPASGTTQKPTDKPYLNLLASMLRDRVVLPLRAMLRRTGLSQKLAFFVGVMVAVGFISIFALRGYAYAHSAVEVQSISNHAHTEPVRVEFSRPVRGSVKYTWQEKVAGDWRQEKTLTGVRALVFTPAKPLRPGAILRLTIQDIRPAMDIMSKTPSEQTVYVLVERAPRIRSLVPANKAQDVRIDTPLSVRLSAPNRGLRELVLSGDIPVASPKAVTRDDVTFTWTLRGALGQGKTYRAEVRDTHELPEKQVVAVFEFTTVPEPVPSTSLSGYLQPNQKITLDFDQDMVQNESVVFAMPGKGGWEGPRRYGFTTSLVVPGTTYSYKVLKGAVSTRGGTVSEDKVFYAQTPGAVKVIGAQPSGTRIALNAPVKLTFDQPVDHASAQSAFTISPQVQGSFSWSGNTMVFTPAGYGYQTTYTYGVAPGIKPVFGLTGVGYSNQFTSVYEVRKLGVPYFRQAHALSCEAASLRMALAYYGVGTNDDEILGQIGYAPQPRDTVTNTWQDPNVEFVGDVDGKMNVTGWGVYAGPVAKAARSFGRSADVIYSPSAASVASAIYAGRPVVMWGVMGVSAVDDSWNTATSGVVHAAKNQHVRLVYGVEGSAENPVGFYLHDPLRGSVYLTAGALQASMNGGGRQILTVY